MDTTRFLILGGRVTPTSLQNPITYLTVMYKDMLYEVSYFQLPRGWSVHIARWDREHFVQRGVLETDVRLIGDAIEEALRKLG